MKSGVKIANSILDLIGEIPLVRLNKISSVNSAEILVKPEFLNPSGSIKDRIALRMIEDAEKTETLRSGITIIEATTGNTGTALAFVAAVKGYRFIAYSPAKVANKSRMGIMLAYGASVEVVDNDSMITKKDQENSVHGGRIELVGRQVCLEITKKQNDVWWARQFSNYWNTETHRTWTAREILEMTDGKLDAFVTSVGTGGTLLGIAHALKVHDPSIIIVSVEPYESSTNSGSRNIPIIPGISDGIIPQMWDSGLIDREEYVTDEEAINMAHQLAEKEGIFCGISSGANVVASTRVAKELGPGKRIVTILPDSRDRYLEVEKYTT